jgi:hypothetical protein
MIPIIGISYGLAQSDPIKRHRLNQQNMFFAFVFSVSEKQYLCNGNG